MNFIKWFISWVYGILLCFLIALILAFALIGIEKTFADRDTIREARIQACGQAYNEYEEWIEERYIHNQDWIARCFSYMSIVYAKESGFWQSRRCLEDYNCFWIKNLSVDRRPLDWIATKVWNGRFLIFENYDDWNLLFARLYARWNMNKTIREFVVWYSTTDQSTYISFMRDNFWKFYNIWLNL